MISPASHTPPLTAPMILLMSWPPAWPSPATTTPSRCCTIGEQFSLSNAAAGGIVTTAQLSYAAGLMLLVPLGDMYERRGLIVLMTLLSSASLLVSAFAPNITVLMLGTALTGMLSVVAQILVPFAATLALPHERGKAVGAVMSGLLLASCWRGPSPACWPTWAAGAPSMGGVPADAGHVRRAVARAAAPPEPGGTELSAPAGLDPAHVRR